MKKETKITIGIVVSALVLMFGMYKLAEYSSIQAIKNSYIRYSNAKTIGQALDEYYGDTTWTLEKKGNHKFVKCYTVVENSTGVRELEFEFTFDDEGGLEKLSCVKMDGERIPDVLVDSEEFFYKIYNKVYE